MYFSEVADRYLAARWMESSSTATALEPAPFVTVSRQAGSGGSSFACTLARKLNSQPASGPIWRVYEANLTAHMLREHALPTGFAKFLPEGRVSEIHATIGELVGLHPNLWELVQKTNTTIRNLATQGASIIVGRGANFATQGYPRGLHVRLVADETHRAQFLAHRYNISEAEARVYNARCEAARNRYVKATFNADATDPLAYDLVINTGVVTLDDAADLVMSRLGSMMETVANSPAVVRRRAVSSATW